jgi:hypothetical protein
VCLSVASAVEEIVRLANNASTKEAFMMGFLYLV